MKGAITSCETHDAQVECYPIWIKPNIFCTTMDCGLRNNSKGGTIRHPWVLSNSNTLTITLINFMPLTISFLPWRLPHHPITHYFQTLACPKEELGKFLPKGMTFNNLGHSSHQSPSLVSQEGKVHCLKSLTAFHHLLYICPTLTREPREFTSPLFFYSATKNCHNWVPHFTIFSEIGQRHTFCTWKWIDYAYPHLPFGDGSCCYSPIVRGYATSLSFWGFSTTKKINCAQGNMVQLFKFSHYDDSWRDLWVFERFLTILVMSKFENILVGKFDTWYS